MNTRSIAHTLAGILALGALAAPAGAYELAVDRDQGRPLRIVNATAVPAGETTVVSGAISRSRHGGSAAVQMIRVRVTAADGSLRWSANARPSVHLYPGSTGVAHFRVALPGTLAPGDRIHVALADRRA
ncbi:MAG: hypothetical protein AB7Q97_06715 [Gammaproteobacteria bacterium]